MSHLRVFLFGYVRVVHAGYPTIKMARSGQILLAYLLLQRDRCHPREQLAGLFWGDYSQDGARRCLNTALWRLRQILEPEGVLRGTYLLTNSTGEIGFNPESDYWLDTAAFETQLAQILTKPIQSLEAAEVETLKNALQLYTGELLEGFYDDWALRERERLRRLYLNSLAHLMYYYKHHQVFQEGLTCGQQILDQDPLREEIHREMMRLYLENGQRALAVRQYEHCCEILATELGIPPMTETQALHTQIVTSSPLPPLTTIQTREPAGNQQIIQQLELAIQKFDEAREQLQQAIELVKQSTACQDRTISPP